MKEFLDSIHPLLKKALFLLGLILILAIPLRFISAVVYERDSLYKKTVNNIGSK
ncbi:inner membrane CreD family protein [Cetobacterium somerae]